MFKKAMFLPIVAGIIIVACSGQSANNDPPGLSATVTQENEYALYQRLNYYQRLIEEHRIQILSWQFARAVLSDDIDTMRRLMVPDAMITVTMDIFYDRLDFMILRDIQWRSYDHRAVSPELWRSASSVELSYEFRIRNRDSFAYLVITMKQTEDDWKVFGYGFES